jgi:hypothetical protein
LAYHMFDPGVQQHVHCAPELRRQYGGTIHVLQVLQQCSRKYKLPHSGTMSGPQVCFNDLLIIEI